LSLTRLIKSKNYKITSYFLFFLFFFLASVHLPLFANSNKKAERFNLLLITIDTLRADRLSCYNSSYVKTPNIDGLADKSILFTRCFAHNSLTLPSHTNILLGTTPLFHGTHDNVNFNVKDEFLTLAEHLKGYGYSTGAFVSSTTLDSRYGLGQGFDVYDDEYKPKGIPKFARAERRADSVIDNAQEWLGQQKNPWFLWIHLFDPHIPYEPPDPFRVPFAKNPYEGEVAYVDFILGKFFNFLTESASYNNTLIVFTSDHGESLGQHGERTHGKLVYNSTIWVPLILYIPGVQPSKINQNTSHIDIFPTVCDYLNVDKPDILQGISVLPAIKGGKLDQRKIYFESLMPYYNLGCAPLRGYIENNKKFFDTPIPELYDLDKDFEENENLAEKENLAEYRRHLENIKGNLSHPEKTSSRSKLDTKKLEKLRSLGYIANPISSARNDYGPEDDVKLILPLYNKIMDAFMLKEEGKADEGIKQLKIIIEGQKKMDFAFSNLAKLYRGLGQMPEALKVLREGLQQYPSSYEIISLYSEYLIDAEQYDEIIEVLDSRSLFQMEQSPLLWYYKGIAHLKKGNSKNAIQALDRAISVDDEFIEAIYSLGTTHLSLFMNTKTDIHLTESLKNLQRVLEIDPNNTGALNILGIAYLQRGHLDKAISSWEKALKLNPKLDRIYYYLGMAYYEKGKMNESLAYLLTYKSIYYSTLSYDEKQKLDRLIAIAATKMR